MKCCICHKEIEKRGNYSDGNNPFPYVVTPGARCCDKCNAEFVIPARMAAIHQTPAVTENRGQPNRICANGILTDPK